MLRCLSTSAFEKCSRIRHIVLLCTVLAVITVTVYVQVRNHPFLNFDDPSYVIDNLHVSSGITGKNIVWAFTSVDESNWHPITWLSHMVDAQIYGMNPRGHHLTNVIIHTISSLLLLLFLLRCTGSLWQSSFVAAMFALHPLHVESVAWVAERKDVLSTFFWFLTLIFYCEYVAKRKPALYIISLFCFVLGLMSKPMLVTLPAVMLLVDIWPLDRYRHGDQEQEVRQRLNRVLTVVKEKISFFACSFLSSIVTIYAQHKGGAISSLDMLSISSRIENALIAYVKYIGKTLWPHDLAILYPMPSSFQFWQVIGSLSFLLLVSVTVIRARHRFPYLLMGWFWFLITLLPVIGLIQVGTQSMADRYTYIPVTGLFIMAAWGVPEMTRELRCRNTVLGLLAAVVIIASAALTWHQLGYWRDSITLYRHTLHVTTGSYLVHYNLGIALAEKGDQDAAINEYQEAIRISPDKAEAHGNLGLALTKKGDFAAAIQECQVALRINPHDTKAHYNLGVAFDEKGSLDAAIHEYQEAIRISPDNTKAHNNLGVALAGKGELDAAISEYHAALRINPNDPKAHYNLGRAFAKKGDVNTAIQEFQTALRISPDNKDAYKNLGVALVGKGNMDEALRIFQEVLRKSPDDIDAHCYLGVILAKQGDLAAAIRSFQNALRINPNDTYAQNNLRIALATKKAKDGAVK